VTIARFNYLFGRRQAPARVPGPRAIKAHP